MRILKLVLVAGLLPVLGLPLAARADLLWGISGHPFTAYPGIPYRQQLELVKDLGMRSYRVNISVPSQAPMLAKLVADAKPLGIAILPVVTPALNLQAESAEQLYARAYKMAVALVSQFKDDIRVWELGNELENFAIIKPCEMRDNGEQYNCNWGPAGGVSPLDYHGPRWTKVSAVLKGLSEGTMSVDPTIRKAMGTAGWGHVGAFERMHQDGIKWDISVWHMYGDDPEAAFRFLARYNRPIWVTEFNNPYGSRRSEEEQVSGLLKQMQRLRELQHDYNVEAAHAYELLDEPYWAPSFEAVMGLVRLEKGSNGRWKFGGRKQAYDAVKQLIAGASIDSLMPAPGQTSKAGLEPGTAAAEPHTIPSIERHGCDLAQLAKAPQPISRQVQVEYAYCLILGRPSEAHGKAAWLAVLRNSSSVETVLIGMLASSEFAIKYPIAQLSDEGVVTFAYRLLLDREPDEHGLSSLVGQLERGSGRADLAKGVISSDEFRSKHPVLSAPESAAAGKAQPDPGPARSCELRSYDRVDPSAENKAAYVLCLTLGREPARDVLAQWTAELARGTPPWKMLITLLESTEFNELYATSRLNSSEFASLLYHLLLDRAPDGGSLSSYVAQLDRGALSRADLVKALIASSEFRSKRPLVFSAAQPPGERPQAGNPQPNPR